MPGVGFPWTQGRWCSGHLPRKTSNIDHIAVAASGVWVIDAKKYKGVVQPRDVGHFFKIDNRLFVSAHAVTADDAYRLLRAVLNTAVTDGLVLKSPYQVKGAGQVRSPERPIATVAELATAVEAIQERYRVAILLAAWCQLRRGELLALQRRHVDLLHERITVEQAWVVPMGGKAMIGPPKTEASIRRLSIPSNILPALENHLDRFVGPEPDAWLFGTSTGTALLPRNFNRVWSKAREKAGRTDLHLHDLRHSGLTWAAAAGATTKELMRRAGQKSPRAALIYQHATEDRDRAIAEALAGLAVPAPVVSLAKRRRGH